MNKKQLVVLLAAAGVAVEQVSNAGVFPHEYAPWFFLATTVISAFLRKLTDKGDGMPPPQAPPAG